MTAILRAVSTIVAFEQVPASSTPRQRHVDWNRDLTDLPVSNPRNETYALAPGELKAVFNGTRSLSVAGDSEMELALLSGTTDHYLFRWTGGDDPVFRTDRGLDLSGATVAMAVNANGTLTMTVAAGDISDVVVGDTLWIAGSDEGVSSPFGVLNRDFWIVLATTSSALVLQRDGDFQGASESGIAVSAANQVQAYSSAGVQVGDKLNVSGGFATVTQRTFSIVAVTSKFLEIVSSLPLPEEEDISPTAEQFVVYTSAKRFLRIEADQECVLRLNGDAGSSVVVSPWIAGDPTKIGTFEKSGPTWSLSVLNKSPLTLHLIAISCE